MMDKPVPLSDAEVVGAEGAAAPARGARPSQLRALFPFLILLALAVVLVPYALYTIWRQRREAAHG